MTKSLVFLCLIVIALGESSIVHKEKIYLTTCSSSTCTDALTKCAFCFGETQCKKCISDFNEECVLCASEVFSEPSFTIGGTVYPMICDSTQALQVSVCNIRCRSEWFTNGNCVKVENAPVCQCSTTTAPPTVAPTVPSEATTTRNQVTGSNINYL